jgi:hypothetical protein
MNDKAETTEPTAWQIRQAALRWCGAKERETFQADIDYFEANWRSAPGLRLWVGREVERDNQP